MKFCRRKQNCILIFLMGCLLLCGICFDEVSVHSVLRAENDYDREVFLSDCAVLGEQEIWAQEDILLQQSNLRALQYGKRDGVRNYFRLFANILLGSFVLKTLLSVYGLADSRYLTNCFSHRFIIGYIHRTDGEKEY